MNERYRVRATALNLRREPRVTPSNRLALLPEGHPVEKVTEAAAPWWRIKTTLDGAGFTGYAHSDFLVPDESFRAPEPARGLPGVHLREDRADITPRVAFGRAFPLGDPVRPRPESAETARLRHLDRVIDYLAVDRSPRYLREGAATFCNIYAYDYCYLSGVYLPRVWWTGRALQQLALGAVVRPLYGDTIREMRANDLYDWFEDFGQSFGWRRAPDLDTLQDAANAARLGVIVAQRTQLERPGHISVVVPEGDGPGRRAKRQGARVVRPLQSQAGSSNFPYFTGANAWWLGNQFRTFGYWIYGGE